jgi:hypothetical protein
MKANDFEKFQSQCEEKIILHEGKEKRPVCSVGGPSEYGYPLCTTSVCPLYGKGLTK